MMRWCTQHSNYNDTVSIRLHSRTQPHTSPFQATCGVSFVSYTTKKSPRYIVDVLHYSQEYDAFVSYSHADAHWVSQELRPFLEDQEPHFRLCLHDRDFLAGAEVVDNICTAVNISRRTIIVLSKAFLRSRWCDEEFRQAHYKVSYMVLTHWSRDEMSAISKTTFLIAELATSHYLIWWRFISVMHICIAWPHWFPVQRFTPDLGVCKLARRFWKLLDMIRYYSIALR